MKDREQKILTTVEIVGATALALFLSTLAFTQKQRRWILDRDNEQCQAPFRHRHGGRLEVHHILPQGYSSRMGIEDYDYPENGITLCQVAHDTIHPDVPKARGDYHQDVGSFGKLREQRSEKLDKKQIYWNDDHDRQLQVVAIRRTQGYRKLFKFPDK